MDDKKEKVSPILGAIDSHLVDAEALGERVMQSMRKTPEQEILDQIRDWLKRGAYIRATDKDGTILQEKEDGRWESGMTITFPRGKEPQPIE